MGIISAELRALPQTGNPIFLNFDDKVNLFIGPNATGKTAILQEIAKVFSSATQGDNPTLKISKNSKEAFHLYIPAIRVSLREDAMSMQLHQPKPNQDLEIKEMMDGNSILVTPANKVFNKITHSHNGRHFFEKDGQPAPIQEMLDESAKNSVALTKNAWDAMNEFLDGEITIGELKQIKGQIDPRDEDQKLVPIDDVMISAMRNNWRATLAETTGKLLGNYHSFQGYDVDVVIDLISRMTSIEVLNENDFRKLMNVGYFCAQTICPETLQGDLPHEIRGRQRIGVGILTGDDTSGGRYGRRPLQLGVLSSGTQGTLLWVWALAVAMATHHSWEDDWEKKPAILFIDEIENHLHPTWQRRVIPALLDHFPGLQIFATTHSPFVVAGLKAGQVHLLRRDENGVTATTNTEDVIGWTADEILRTMMGVDEPTDLLTIERANQLKQLREKETLTPEETDKLNELRRQVNESLLSRNGPVGLQTERYADLMKRFLLSRQSDLAQDGG